MLELALKSLVAYLLGALVGSLVLGRLRGIDIRSMGSGNAGATNALRTQGKLFAVLVLVVDVGKGGIAASWIPLFVLPGLHAEPQVARQWLVVACSCAVIVGHVYPVWFGFRGGKGVATVVGVVSALDSRLLLPLFLCWFAVVLLTGYVGLASILAGAALIAAAIWMDSGNLPLLAFAILAALLVTYTHRGNIARMAAGTESRARRLWLLRPRAA